MRYSKQRACIQKHVANLFHLLFVKHSYSKLHRHQIMANKKTKIMDGQTKKVREIVIISKSFKHNNYY